MSATPAPNDSPMATIQPLHNPSQAAYVVVPKAPLGNVNQAPGMGAKALLAKKMAKNHNPTFVSPTDNLMTPCTQKLNAARRKNFDKGAKPVQLFSQPDDAGSDDETPGAGNEVDGKILPQDDENPF